MVPPKICIIRMTQAFPIEWNTMMGVLSELQSMNRLRITVADSAISPNDLNSTALAGVIAKSDFVLLVMEGQTENATLLQTTEVLSCLDIAVQLRKPVHVFVAGGEAKEPSESTSQNSRWKKLDQVSVISFSYFDARLMGDLTHKVRETLHAYMEGFNNIKTDLTLILLDAYDEMASRFTDLEFVRRQRNYDNQLRSELGDDEFVTPRALMTFARAALGQRERHREADVCLYGEWLDKVWLYVMAPLPPWDQQALANNHSELHRVFWDWVETSTSSWFSSLCASLQALVITWCIDRSLVFRCAGEVYKEMKLMTFAQSLAEHERWNVGNKGEQTRERFYDAYVSGRWSAAPDSISVNT